MKYSKPAIFFFLFFVSCVSGGKPFHKWNEYVRNTRQSTDLPFVPLSQKSSRCPQAQERQHDALGRRASGLLVPPQNQGRCGSCWAFASAHVYADQININGNSRTTTLSTDHLTKCAPSGTTNNGCCGNSPSKFLPYLRQMGFQRATCLPYTLVNYIPRGLTGERRISFKRANPLTCPVNCADGSSFNSLLLAGYSRIGRQDVVTALSRGPVYASMYITDCRIDRYSLYNYGCGVLSYPDTYRIFSVGRHAVEIVDYSSGSFGGTPFFVVKNSWSNSFGESGYFRIAQNAPVLISFYSFNAGIISSASNTTSTELDAQATCGVDEANTTDVMVQTAAEFGLQELTNSSLVKCRGSEVIPTLTLETVINGTQQIVSGILFDLTVRARVAGCDYTSATVRVTVLQELDDSFTLLSYNYEETMNTTPNSSSVYPTVSFYTLLFAFLLVLTYGNYF